MKPKLRDIIWVIILVIVGIIPGIICVADVLFRLVFRVGVILTRQLQAKLGKRVEVEDIPKEVKRWTREIDRIARFISRLSGEDAARGQELLQKTRTAIEEFQTLSDPDQLTAKRSEIVDDIAELELRRLKRAALQDWCDI